MWFYSPTPNFKRGLAKSQCRLWHGRIYTSGYIYICIYIKIVPSQKIMDAIHCLYHNFHLNILSKGSRHFCSYMFILISQSLLDTNGSRDSEYTSTGMQYFGIVCNCWLQFSCYWEIISHVWWPCIRVAMKHELHNWWLFIDLSKAIKFLNVWS